ncbi:MAG: TIGR01777 family oxidoreductase [Bacteroidetes bacterium]|nr:TIGR01777 family oxidoreductase [Bacteroidota bacterium]
MKTIGITGGTGFVGRHVTNLLISKDYNVVIFTRNPKKYNSAGNISYALWNPETEDADSTDFQKLDGVIHLAGEGVADKRWTPKRKQEILESRTKGTAFLVKMLQNHAPNCMAFISASGIGYYGPDMTGKPFTENDPAYNDFLGNTCVQWENASKPVEPQMRRVLLRIGIVLGKEAGAFYEFEKPTRFGILPILGGGRQVVSWIHIDDLAALFVHALETESMHGPYNAVAPVPVAQKLLMYTIAHVKGLPPLGIPVPSFALKLMLGEMSIEVLKSATVSSAKTEASGFVFRYPTITKAVRQLLGK